jgi:ribosomal protein S18 acetylase RimI-like enzyme
MKTQNQNNIKFIHLHAIEYNTAAIALYIKMGF